MLGTAAPPLAEAHPGQAEEEEGASEVARGGGGGPAGVKQAAQAEPQQAGGLAKERGEQPQRAEGRGGDGERNGCRVRDLLGREGVRRGEEGGAPARRLGRAADVLRRRLDLWRA